MPTLVCLHCGRDLLDWQLIAGTQLCAGCYQRAVNEDEQRRKMEDDTVKDLMQLVVILVLCAAAAFMLFWFPFHMRINP